MADVLGSVDKVVKLALSIKKAVQTVRRNKVRCHGIEKLVSRVSAILVHLQATGMVNELAMSSALEDLVETLDSALKKITYCQKKHYLSSIIGSGDVAEQLHRVHDDISNKMMLVMFATHVHSTVLIENLCLLSSTPTVSIEDDVTQVGNGSSFGKKETGSHSNNSTSVHEISGSSETDCIHSIVESKNILPSWSGAVDIYSSSTNAAEVHDLGDQKDDENAAKGEVNIEEYDLEKILDEQETHDLYCPNCKSCITRRVILKKRKRTARQARRDGSPKKIQLEEPCANVSNQAPDESYDQELPDIFGCLSCFSIFIPTGCGFNIFRIFQRRDQYQQVQIQYPTAPDSLKEPLLNGSLSSNVKAPIEDIASSLHSHVIVHEAEQFKKPSPVHSVQTTTATNEEENKQPYSEFHGTASSPVIVRISPSLQSETVDSEGPPHITMPTLLGDETPPASSHRDGWDIQKATAHGDLSVIPVAAAAKTSLKKFSLSELEDATHNFLEDNIIGRGGFATVYKGVLHDGFVVAVKKIQYPYQLSMERICDELTHVSKLEHKNIVQLLGYGHGVLERAEMLQDNKVTGGKDDLYLFLVEEYMTNGSLDNIIYGSKFDWSSRFSLMHGIAHGLIYLHEQQHVHLDLKPDNVLIDSDMNPKITDFGRARMLDQGDDVTTRDTDYLLAGTMGYMPPEYIMEGIVSKMYDVYSFGVILLESISSMCGFESARHQASIKWAWTAREAGQMEELLDPSLCSESQVKEARRCLEIGLLCTQSDWADRPTMVDVVEMLELDSRRELPTPKQQEYTKGRSA
ncbi:unnamed protein product [Urochloa decumbens]|uniref:Protein kinase domain-containing protein n=1 Tax=Urochloa decumbens TaxID=240449 RepID=A0ABC9CG15_9POAL